MLPNHWSELTLQSTPEVIIDEFIKKYKGCWIWYEIPGKSPHLVLFERYKDGFFFFHHDEFGEISCSIESEVTLRVTFPRRGAFTGEAGYCLFRRIPARQYRKAPCEDNCKIVSPLGSLSRFDYGLDLTSRNLQDAFHKNFIEYPLGLEMLREGKRGFAINSSFGVTRYPNSRKKKEPAILWYLNNPIGYAQPTRLELKVPVLKQEVLDMIRRERIDVEVV